MELLGESQPFNMEVPKEFQPFNMELLGESQPFNMEVPKKFQPFNMELLGESHQLPKEFLSIDVEVPKELPFVSFGSFHLYKGSSYAE